MAGFKTLNSVDPTVRRPLRISDLQDLWVGINSLFTGLKSDTAYVVSGFDVSENVIRGGVLYYNSGGEDPRLFYYSGGDVSGTSLRLYRVDSGDSRVFADGTTRVFSFNNIVTSEDLGDDYIDEFYVDEDFAMPNTLLLTTGAVTADKIANGAVTTGKIAEDAITANKVRRYAITGDKIANSAVSFAQQAVGTQSLKIEIASGGVSKSLPQRNTFTHAAVGGVSGDAFLFILNDATTELVGRVLKHEILFENSAAEAKPVTVDFQGLDGSTKAAYAFDLGANAKKLLHVFVYYATTINGNPTFEVFISE